MNNTISDLWNGNIAPCEHCNSHDPEVNKLIGQIERHRESLRGELNDAQKNAFQKYIDCSKMYLLRMMELVFCEGFSLGSKLMFESYI